MTGNRKIFSTSLGAKIKETWALYIAPPTGAGNLEVSRVLYQMVPECNPHLVALIGCAGGFPDKIEPFDVVVAPRVDYIARTKVSERTQIRPQQEVCSSTFIDHCKNVQLLDLWHQYLLPDVSNARINVHFEPIIAGETVLTNSRSQFFRSVQASSPKAVAIEMEGYGFLSTCRELKVEAAVIRGISDTLDNKNHAGGDEKPLGLGMDQSQFKATRHAAALFFATLDFVNASAFRKSAARGKTDVTEVSMVLDAEMHDVGEIQADLFELFKKYGIRNFSFKPANSVRVSFFARLDALRIYEALVAAGIVDKFGGFRVMSFGLKAEHADDRELNDMLRRIEKLHGASADEVLQIMRVEGWMDDLPGHAAIVLDALEYQQEQDRKAARQKKGRILYQRPPPEGPEAQSAQYLGRRTTPAIILTDTRELSRELERAQPSIPKNELLSWFMGNSLLDREIGLDVLLAHSRQRLFYVWPGLATIYAACNLPEKAFIDGCTAEWQMARGAKGPSILQLLDQQGWDRLGRGQIRDAMAGRPATLSKSIDILAVACRILSQNDLPVEGCVVPALYVLTFNGTIAGDGAVERMLLTGLSGDLAQVARATDLPLLAVQSAVRGDTLPLRAASKVASALQGAILKNSKLNVSTAVLDADDTSKRRREAVVLDGKALKLYVAP